MLAGDIEPKEVVEMVESSYRNSQRLQKLTQNILEVARIDNNTLRLERETFDLNELVRQSISDVRRYQYRNGTDQTATDQDSVRTKTTRVAGER